MAWGADTLPALAPGKAPQSLSELWGDYDPRKEALEAEVTKEWEQDGIVCRVVRYRVGTFKGQPATMAAFYAFPKGAKGLPAILQIHGGGQSASLSSVTTYAKLGYAALSLNWGGNKMTFADGKVYDGPNTDWGALDATHPPQRNKANHFALGPPPDTFTLDAVDSPRNDNWFIVCLSARRGLTFLERQPEVDGAKLGVTGHSMGGRLTTMVTGIDPRVQASVPSCGGSGDFDGDPAKFPGTAATKRSARDLATISENPYIARIKVPTLWFSPTNDFHAHQDNFAYSWRQVPDALLGLALSPHFNHRHADDASLTATLWFEQHLKGKFTLPRTPTLQWARAADGNASFTITPDLSRPVKEVRFYASTDTHTLTRFWRTIPVAADGQVWRGSVPVRDTLEPLFVFANVVYAAPEEYRKIPTNPGVGQSDSFIVSSRPLTLTSAQLVAADVRANAQPEAMIDDGARGWQDWYRLNWGNPTLWSAFTRKVKDPLWRGPAGAKLSFEINPANDTIVYVTLTRNAWGAFGPGTGDYVASVPLKANGGWVAVSLGVEDFKPADSKGAQPLKDWSTLTELAISGHASIVQDGVKTSLPSVAWKNAKDVRVRALKWSASGESRVASREESRVESRDGSKTESRAGSRAESRDGQGDTGTRGKELTEAERTKAFNDSIKKSLEQEARDR